MSKIRCCFFDIGGVLIHFNRMKMIEDLADVCRTSADHILQFLEEGVNARYETGHLSFDEIYILFEKWVGKQLSPTAIKKAFCSAFSLNTEIEPLIWKLKKASIPLFALSNTCDVHFDYLHKQYPMLRLFTGFILSYEVGAMKPSPRIFQKAIEKSGFLPSNCFFVDDIPEFTHAAEEFGIVSATFQDAYALESKLIELGVIG